MIQQALNPQGINVDDHIADKNGFEGKVLCVSLHPYDQSPNPVPMLLVRWNFGQSEWCHFADVTLVRRSQPPVWSH